MFDKDGDWVGGKIIEGDKISGDKVSGSKVTGVNPSNYYSVNIDVDKIVSFVFMSYLKNDINKQEACELLGMSEEIFTVQYLSWALKNSKNGRLSGL